MDSNGQSLCMQNFGCPNNGIFHDKLSNSNAQEAFCTSKTFWTVSLLAGYKILLWHLPNFSWNHFSWGVSGGTDVIACNCSRMNTNCKQKKKTLLYRNLQVFQLICSLFCWYSSSLTKCLWHVIRIKFSIKFNFLLNTWLIGHVTFIRVRLPKVIPLIYRGDTYWNTLTRIMETQTPDQILIGNKWHIHSHSFRRLSYILISGTHLWPDIHIFPKLTPTPLCKCLHLQFIEAVVYKLCVWLCGQLSEVPFNETDW